MVDHSVDACCDSSRHHLAACCPNAVAADASYEVEALDCIHDVKGAVVMHERGWRAERDYDEGGGYHQDVDLGNADEEGVTDDRSGNTRY